MDGRVLTPMRADPAGALALVAAITPILAGGAHGGFAGHVLAGVIMLPTILGVLAALGPDQGPGAHAHGSSRILELGRAVLIANIACVAGLTWIVVLAMLLVLVFASAVALSESQQSFLVFPGVVLATVVWMTGAYWLFRGLDRARRWGTLVERS